MTLTSLHLHGFRTFARPSEFRFAPRVTGIVGPPDCGKTNFLKSIQWCLQDDEAQHPVDHLFFAGTHELRPSAIAEVTLNFTGPDDQPLSVTRTRFRRDPESSVVVSGTGSSANTLANLQAAVTRIQSPAGLSQLTATGCRHRVLLLDALDTDLAGSDLDAFHANLESLHAHNQMLVVTHNKRTMGRSDTLIGVTMEEYGVSKLIAMRLV